MKRQVLVDIPCVLILVLSTLMVFYTYHQWQTYKAFEEILEMTEPGKEPSRYLMRQLERLSEERNEVSNLIMHIKANHLIHAQTFEIMQNLVVASKKRNEELMYFSGAFLFLSLFMSNGLARHYRQLKSEK